MGKVVKDPPPRVEAPPVPGRVPLIPPDPPQADSAKPRGKPGPKPKAIREAERRAELEANAIETKDMLAVTAALLGVYAFVVKGDAATREETERVNVALVAVANKHGGRFKYFEETMLAVALATTAMAMRQRRREGLESERARRATPKVVPIVPEQPPDIDPPDSGSTS